MSLAEIRAKLMAQENRTQTQGQSSSGDSQIYPHWNIDEGSTAVIRFLPDGDTTNSFFWVERAMIKLPFNGVKGQDSKPVVVQVPCMEMYGENCPILAEVRTWYKDDSLKEMANKYWKKRTYLFQGFVRENPLSDDKLPENPIRRFVISPQIFTVIKSTLIDPEIEELPTEYKCGLDFKVVKGSKGGWSDYSTSGWARRESELTNVEYAAIEAHGLFTLKDYLPKKPSESEIRIIREMFEASVNGDAYDSDRWGQYYKPWGLDTGSSQSQSSGQSSTSVTSVSAPVSVTETVAKTAHTPDMFDETEIKTADEVKVSSTVEATSSKATDILAMIRAKQQKA
jgi:hypothetical protein